MAYKIVFLDIDGTLLNSHHQISPETKATIQALTEKMGIVVVLATARPYYGAYFFREELQLDSPMICFNGALIVGTDGKPVVNHTISKADTNVVATTALAHQINLAFLDLEKAYTLKKDDWATVEENLTRKKALVLPYEKILRDWENRGIPGANKLMGMGHPDKILTVQAKLRADEEINLTINTSHPSYLEITHLEASKQHALRHVHTQMGFSTDEVVAIGDSFNDTEMLRYAGLGIAMGNAHPEVKAAAQKTTLSNDENGVSEALKEIFF